MAQDDIHWAYASYFGTGRYSLDNGVDTTVIGFTPRRAWRRPAISDSGERSPGYEFRLPVSLGAHEFASLESIDELTRASINAVSVMPGVEIQIPMSGRWSLKSLSYVGLGTETRSGVDARIFRFGLRSRFAFAFDDTDMDLVNSLERIGYSADGGVSDAINLLTAGFDFSRPLRNKKLGGEPLAIYWHVMYTNYLDTLGLDLSRATLRPGTIGSEWELGAAFGRQAGRLQFWRLRLDRVGLAYRFGSHHQFEGVAVVFRSLFDR